MENLEQDHLTSLDLEIDAPVRQQLFEGAKWAKFISIVMFVACGFILLFGIVGGAALTTAFSRFNRGIFGLLGEMGGGAIILIVILVAAVMGMIYYFLYNFSRKVKAGLLSESTSELNAGLQSLKTFFIITTVFAICALLINIYTIITAF